MGIFFPVVWDVIYKVLYNQVGKNERGREVYIFIQRHKVSPQASEFLTDSGHPNNTQALTQGSVNHRLGT